MATLLVPIEGGKPYMVSLPMTLVGSKEGCDLRIESDGVAPHCCVLALVEQQVLLRDLDTGSIKVNGQYVRRAILQLGDRLTLGDREFSVQSLASERSDH